MTTLYELADLRDVIDRALDATEGELTDELAQALDAWEGAFADKVERVAMWASEEQRLAEAAREEAKSLTAKAQAREARVEWAKRYLQAQLERVGKTKVEGAIKTVALAANPPKVEALTPLDDAELRNIASWAPQYVRHDESWTLDKKRVLADHKAGTLDPDVGKRVAIVQSHSVRIR